VSDGLSWPDWAYGDPFQVYPGPDGPIDIAARWEVFRREPARITRCCKALRPLARRTRRWRRFTTTPISPRDADWIAQRRAELLEMLESALMLTW